MSHEEPPVDYKQKLESIIANAPASIEAEFYRTPNPWWACVNSTLQALMSGTGLAVQDGQMSKEEGEVAVNKVRDISASVKAVARDYPTRKDTVPEEVKQELLSKLDIFK